MKNLIIFLLFSIMMCPFACLAQDTIGLGFKEKKKYLKYEPSDTLKIPYTVQITGNYFPDKDDNINIEISTDSEELNPFLNNGKIKIIQSVTKGELLFHANDSTSVSLKTVVSSIYDKNGFLTLKIKTLTTKEFKLKSTKKITISLDQGTKLVGLRQKDNHKNLGYNFYIGTNFDLKDKLKANSFYSEIDVFLPGQFFEKENGVSWGGIRVGIYKNNLTSTIKEQSGDGVIYELLENSTLGDSVTLEKKLITKTPKTSFSNLGFYAELLMRVHKSKNEKFQVFVAPHAEIIQRVETTTFESEDIVSLGRITIPRDSILTNPINSLISSNRERTIKYFNSYFGVGLPTKYLSKKIEVFLNPVLGFGDSALSGNRDEQGKFFGIFQFHLIELNHGIKLSGEVRKYFNANQDPLMIVNLSKSFNLDSLFDSNKEKTDN